MIDKDNVQKFGLMDQIKREISVMRLLKHPRVLHLFEVMATRSRIYFVLEYAKGGELFNKIAKGKLSEEAARKYFQQLVGAVEYCNIRGVYNRDLKPEDLLLDENENLKVSDFGLSALVESKRQDGLLHTACGTPAYVAPEELSRKGYSGAKADVWFCGVILFVLAAGYLPFHDRNLIQMYRKISSAEYRCPHYFSAELKELLYGILDPDPNTRMFISRLMRSAWYRKPVRITIPKTGTGDKTCTSEATTTSGFTSCIGSESNQGSPRMTNLNAFDIISHSTGFDMSKLFDDRYVQKEARFTSKHSAAVVFAKLKEVARHLKLRFTNKDNVLKLAATKEGSKGVLELDEEIFEIAPSLLLVGLKKTNGDTLEYQKLMKDDIKPSLRDIVWAWQGDHQQLHPLRHAEQQQASSHY